MREGSSRDAYRFGQVLFMCPFMPQVKHVLLIGQLRVECSFLAPQVRHCTWSGPNSAGGDRDTNYLMGTLLGLVVAFFATVFTDKSGLGISFAGIVEITRNSDLSFSGLVYIVPKVRRKVYTHYDHHRFLDNQ